jgi:hypothetical protein
MHDLHHIWTSRACGRFDVGCFSKLVAVIEEVLTRGRLLSHSEYRLRLAEAPLLVWCRLEALCANQFQVCLTKHEFASFPGDGFAFWKNPLQRWGDVRQKGPRPHGTEVRVFKPLHMRAKDLTTSLCHDAILIKPVQCLRCTSKAGASAKELELIECCRYCALLNRGPSPGASRLQREEPFSSNTEFIFQCM